MEISCTGILFWGGIVCLVIGFLSDDRRWKQIGGWCLGIWAVIQVCGFVLALFLWNSYEPRFQELQPEDCPSHTWTSTDEGLVCKDFITDPTPKRIESSWQFFDLAAAASMVQKGLDDPKYDENTPITIYCTGDERIWQSTLRIFQQELNEDDAIFGVPQDAFCPTGGQFTTN